MAELRTAIHNLHKGKNVENNLDTYIRQMMTNANRLSFVRVALNYPVFYENASELEYAKNYPECIASIVRDIRELTIEALKQDYYSIDTDTILQKAIATRDTITKVMQNLTAFGDRYTIYEYVLNRKEYSYKDTSSMKQFDDETFKHKILAYTSNDSDKSANCMKLIQVLEQLPMRMTRSRFFQIVEDGMRVYIGSEKSSVQDVLFMIRTGSLLEEPETMQTEFEELYGKSLHVAQKYNQDMTEEEFVALQEYFAELFQILNDEMDCVLLAQEMVNDICTILMSAQNAMVNVNERNWCIQIVEKINAMFANPERPELYNELDAALTNLEGVQEQLVDLQEDGEAVLQELKEVYKERMDVEQWTQLNILSKISMLLSTSHFGSLKDDEKESEEASENYIMEEVSKLVFELKSHFKKLSRAEIRAIMAKVITILPLFIRNYNELDSYIEASLANCTDLAEKMACVELINNMIDAEE